MERNIPTIRWYSVTHPFWSQLPIWKEIIGDMFMISDQPDGNHVIEWERTSAIIRWKQPIWLNRDSYNML